MKNLRAKIGIGFDMALMTAAILIALSAFVGWCLAAPPSTGPGQAATQPATKPAWDVLDGAALDQVLATAHAGQTINAQPGGTYRIVNGVSISGRDGITLNLNGSLLSMPTNHTGIWVWANGFTITGARVTSGATFMRSNGRGNGIIGCDFDDAQPVVAGKPVYGLDSVVITDAGDSGFRMIDCNVGLTRAVGAYVCGPGFVLRDCKFAGSMGEYDLRAEKPFTPAGQPVAMWVGGLVQDCEFRNHNQWGKDAVGFRWGSGITFSHNKIYGASVRYGAVQNDPTRPPVAAKSVNDHCTMDHNEYFDGATVRIYQGAVVSADHNLFHVTASTVPYSVDVASTLTSDRDVQSHPPFPVGTKVQAMIATSSGGTHAASNQIERIEGPAAAAGSQK
jgi:hypothetical protein